MYKCETPGGRQQGVGRLANRVYMPIRRHSNGIALLQTLWLTNLKSTGCPSATLHHCTTNRTFANCFHSKYFDILFFFFYDLSYQLLFIFTRFASKIFYVNVFLCLNTASYK